MKQLLVPFVIFSIVTIVLTIRSFSLSEETVCCYFRDSNSSVSAGIRHLVFSEDGCPLTLMLTNRSSEPLILWEPYCPEGDRAFFLEFKDQDNSDNIGIARPFHCYTGGMGIPKTLTLLPGESFEQTYDLSSYWALPFELEDGESKFFWARIVYESRKVASPRHFLPDNADDVWIGKIATQWQRIKLSNQSGSGTGK